MRSSVLLSALVMIAGAAAPAYAKRPIERITVTGPGVARPVELTDSLLLRLSNPWHGNFIEPYTARAAPSSKARVYVLTLHARLRDGELRPIYQFHYARPADGRPGLVYLPGKNDPGYGQNVSIILRPGQDGGWHQATRAWAAYFEEAWASAGQTRAATPGRAADERTGFFLLLAESNDREKLPPPAAQQQVVRYDEFVGENQPEPSRYLLIASRPDVPLTLAQPPRRILGDDGRTQLLLELDRTRGRANGRGHAAQRREGACRPHRRHGRFDAHDQGSHYRWTLQALSLRGRCLRGHLRAAGRALVV